MKTLLPILAFITLVSPVAAGETPWREVAPDVQMRLISTDILSAEGVTWVGIEILMPEATKTYWRVPGESGIPPAFDFSASRGIAGYTVAWPFPRRDTSGGYLDHAYYGHLVLPLELEVDAETARIEAEITLGICSDVCIPVSVEFSHDLAFAAPDRAQALRIDQALAEVPLLLEEDAALGEAVFETAEKILTVAVNDPTFPVEEIIADIAGKMLLFGAPERQQHGQTLVFPLYGKADPSALENARVHFTFPSADGPYEIVRDLTVR